MADDRPMPTARRLLLAATEFPPGPGGIGNHAHQLAQRLSSGGWHVVVLSPQDYVTDDQIAAFNGSHGFTVHRQHHRPLSIVEGLGRLLQLLRVVRQERPGIIVASGRQAVWLTAVGSLLVPTPFVAIAHGGAEFRSGAAPGRLISRWAYERAHTVISVSQYTQRQMLAVGVRPRRMQVIPNGADETFFRPLPPNEIEAIRHRLGFGHASLLLTVGSVTERKGQEVVIRALPQILASRPDVRYVMIGDPILRPQLCELAQSLGVSEHVHFLGIVDRPMLLDCCNICDVFLMTSQHSRRGDFEGYGIAVIEAALCGKPAIVSAGSGLAEAIVDGQTGLVVPEGDPAETAKAVGRLLGATEYRHRLGEAARERALREQTWSIRVQAYEAVIDAILTPETVLPSRPECGC